MNLKLLSEPFPEQDIEWRVQDCGEKNGKIWARVLAYVTNRAIMERLDDVVGIESWKNEYLPGPSGGVVCGISIKIGSEWITKWDGAENSNIEGVKGGLSNSMKRAAVQWGIGRYLYKLEAGFAKISEAGRMSGKLKSGNWFRWDPPYLPEWAKLETREAPKTREAPNTSEAQKRCTQLGDKLGITPAERKRLYEESGRSFETLQAHLEEMEAESKKNMEIF